MCETMGHGNLLLRVDQFDLLVIPPWKDWPVEALWFS